MTIRFDSDGIPSRKDLLAQAAGVGIEFPQGSMQEFQFLALCETIWSHGVDTAITRMLEKLNAKAVSESGEALRKENEPQPI